MTCRFELSVLFLILINVTLNFALTYVTVGTNFRSCLISVIIIMLKKSFILSLLQCIQFIEFIIECMEFGKEFIPVDECSGLLLIEKCEEN